MTLCANGKFIRNNDRYKSYKGQLLIYNLIVGRIQNYIPRYCYIMAKNWKIDSTVNFDEGFSCYDLLGVVDYKTFDNKYIELTKDAIDWVREVRTKGHNWDPYNPHINNMCCNSSNNIDEPWSEIKRDILKHTKDITSIWKLTPTHRNIARSKYIYKYTDTRLTTELLELSDTKTTKTIDKILKINQQNKINIMPDKIKNKIFDWHKSYPTDFYIDFETINTAFINSTVDLNNTQPFKDLIFMIGIGFIVNDTFNYMCLTADEISEKEETKLVSEMIKFINRTSKRLDNLNNYNIRLFHWSNAEVNHFDRVINKNGDLINLIKEDFIWVDLCKIFTDTPIVVRGATTFKLKDIASAMYSLNLISTTWDGELTSGYSAMLSASQYYKNKNEQIINTITDYNLVDCKVMYDIVKYLRNNKF